MKILLTTVLIAITIPTLTLAQAGGAVCFCADPSGNDCRLCDDRPGLLTIYVLHTFLPGATAVQFGAPKPAASGGVADDSR